MALNRFLLVVVIIAVIAMGYAFLSVNGVIGESYSFQKGLNELNKVDCARPGLFTIKSSTAKKATTLFLKNNFVM